MEHDRGWLVTRVYSVEMRCCAFIDLGVIYEGVLTRK